VLAHHAQVLAQAVEQVLTQGRTSVGVKLCDSSKQQGDIAR
jgi:hypothetical protein